MKNEFKLDLDLKNIYTGANPRISQGDNATLNIAVKDYGVDYDTSWCDKVHLEVLNLDSDESLILEPHSNVEFNVSELDKGLYQVKVVMTKKDIKVSTQPIKILVY